MRKSSLAMMGISLSAVVSVLLVTGALGFQTQENGKLTTYEQTGFLGHVILVLKDSDGNIKAYRQTDNIVVNVGKSCAILYLFGQGSTNSTGNTMCGGPNAVPAFRHVGIGTGTGAEDPTNTGITQTGPRGAATAVGLINGTGSGPFYVTIQPATFTGISATITESGLFNAASGGHMFARKVFSAIPMTPADSLTITWRILVS